jgi:hypothetical protein
VNRGRAHNKRDFAGDSIGFDWKKVLQTPTTGTRLASPFAVDNPQIQEIDNSLEKTRLDPLEDRSLPADQNSA